MLKIGELNRGPYSNLLDHVRVRLRRCAARHVSSRRLARATSEYGVKGCPEADVTDFGEAIKNAEEGEVVYLTVLSHGQREQLRVELPGQS